MKKQNRYWLPRNKPTILIAILIMISGVTEVRADSSKADGDGTQKIGKNMGKFMSSFMEGLDTQESSQGSSKKIEQPIVKSPIQNRRTNSRPGSYDPWRARPEKQSAYRYDPWGATRNSRSLTRFADDDWNSERQNYGAGLESWYGPERYRNSPGPQYNNDYRRWSRSYEQGWRGAPYSNPYGADSYNWSR
jgi:hypothetical protein